MPERMRVHLPDKAVWVRVMSVPWHFASYETERRLSASGGMRFRLSEEECRPIGARWYVFCTVRRVVQTDRRPKAGRI